MEETNRCRKCGQARPAEAPGDLCPLCRSQTDAGGGPMPESALERRDMLVTLGPPSSSILATLAQTLGRVPQVLLRGTEPGFGLSPPAPADPDRALRLQLFGVIGHGGMGVVLKGYDADLGRDLAVKVLREQFRDQPEMVRRFIEEAQIGGQLQHPGVVPVYELGSLSDRRPYIAMKLIRGRTLAELLAGRREQDDDGARLLGIFESACQTMAYAHSRGVIHRDLKPSNIMVGSFGEVQVMDWGLAKVLTQVDAPGEEDEPVVRVETPESTVATGRSGDEDERSQPGSVLGTPAYMAPEQARGEVESLDERADVFALGSILCEILTGAPAFEGGTPEEIEQRAALGELDLAHGRLEACGADAELAELARDCLAAAASERPRDARAVAQRITAYREGVQERLRAAELARVEAQARAEGEAKRSGLADQLAAEAQAHAVAERRRRRLTMALAAAVLALVVCGGGASTWFVYQRQAGLARVDLALEEAKLLADQAEGDPEGDVARWHAARIALRHARVLLDTVPAGLARTRLGALEARIAEGTAAAEEDWTMVARLEAIRARLDADQGADRAYAEAFGAASLDPTVPEADPAAIGRRLAGRPQAVARAAASALDAWSIIRRSLTRRGDAGGLAACRRLLIAGQTADPDPWRSGLRDAIARDDLAPLQRLAEGPDLERQRPVSLWLLGQSLAVLGDRERALAILQRARRTYPDDFWLNMELGLIFLGGQRLGPRASGVLVTAPLAESVSKQHAAEPYLMAAVALRPRFAPAHHAMATAYAHLGQWDAALTELHAAVALQPDDATIHNTLGNVLTSQGRWDDAIAAYRQAIQLDPGYNLPHLNLGDLFLTRQGNLAGAIAAYREAVRIAPRFDFGHIHLGVALENQGKRDEAIAEYQEAIRLNSKNFLAHANLGTALSGRGDFAAAAVELGQALDLITDPRRREALEKELAQVRRGAAQVGRLDAVLQEVDHPKDAAEGIEFAWLCQVRKWFTEAVRLYAQALEADPKLADDRALPHRYNAACCALLAAAGQSANRPLLDEPARAALRLRACDWLEAERAAWSRVLRDGPPTDRARIQPTLRHWKQDSDLAGIRAPEALARLPEPERQRWQAFWAQADALLQAAAGRPAP